MDVHKNARSCPLSRALLYKREVSKPAQAGRSADAGRGRGADLVTGRATHPLPRSTVTHGPRDRTQAPYVHFYNHHRAHTALGDKPPISRLDRNNVLRRNRYAPAPSLPMPHATLAIFRHRSHHATLPVVRSESV